MKKNRKTFLTRLLIWLNIFAIIGILLSYCATLINPAVFWPVSYFGLAYPFILLINFIFILIWIIRRKSYFILSTLAIISGIKPLSRTIGIHYKEKYVNTDSATIKLMTYNCGAFQSRKDVERDITTKDILKLVKTEQPDIIGLEEFFTRKKGKYALIDSIKKILKTKEYQFTPVKGNNFEFGGVALFSKFPIVEKGNIIFDSELSGNRCEWIDVKKDDQVFRVYAVHLASIRFQPEDYEFIDETKKDLGTDLHSTKRIIKRLKIAFVKRGNQVKEMKKHMASCKIPYVVMGDFNDTPCSYTLAQMTDGIKNGFKEKGKGLGVTYNGDFPNFQIDYILASNQFNFNSYRIINKDFSDHFPIRCDVVLQNR